MKEKLSVADFVKHLDTYEDHRVDFGRKHSGIMASMKDLEMLIKYLNDNKIIHIDGCVLLDFCSYIRQVRKNCAATMNRKISSIKVYIMYLTFRGVEGADSIKIACWGRARGSYRGPQEALTEDELHELIGLVDRDSVLGQRDHLIYLFMGRLGLRIGEVRRMKFEDINHKRGTIKIHGKGARPRTLPLTADLKRYLKVWTKSRAELKNADQLEEVFISKKGAPIAERTIQDNFKKLIEKAGLFSIEKLTPHSLRHAFASITYENTKDLVSLKHVLGHAKMSSTEIYIHPSFKEMRRSLNDHAASDFITELIGGTSQVHQATG